MKQVINVWKPVGFTPLEIVEKFKEKCPEYKNEIISYAGRLDPMAEGILVLLIGEENKNRNKYLRLRKIYESEIILGISTDTFDCLGLITKVNLKEVLKKDIEKSLNKFIGKQKQIYPAFSSKTVKGKPLFWWARKNKLNEIEIPTREVEVYSIDLLDLGEIDSQVSVSEIIENIEKVNGDFRQKEIIKFWRKFENKNKDISLIRIKIKVSCSSGTYVRGIANDLGVDLGVGGFAFSIKRTGIGKISEKECLKIF